MREVREKIKRESVREIRERFKEGVGGQSGMVRWRWSLELVPRRGSGRIWGGERS